MYIICAVHHLGGIVPTSSFALVVALARSSDISRTHAACSHYIRRYNNIQIF